jgi:hypothetical protein
MLIKLSPKLIIYCPYLLSRIISSFIEFAGERNIYKAARMSRLFNTIM